MTYQVQEEPTLVKSESKTKPSWDEENNDECNSQKLNMAWLQKVETRQDNTRQDKRHVKGLIKSQVMGYTVGYTMVQIRMKTIEKVGVAKWKS